MAYLGNAPARSFISFEKQVFTIVNSQTAYTLSHSVVNENDIRLVVNNVVQEPGSGKAYTASGTTLTLSAALVNGTDEMYCVFLGRAIQTVNPPNASVGSAQVADTLISGKTALASEPDDTDEFLVSDSGTLKRIDYSLIKGSGKVLKIDAQTNNTRATISSATSKTTMLSGTFTNVQASSKILIDVKMPMHTMNSGVSFIGFTWNSVDYDSAIQYTYETSSNGSFGSMHRSFDNPASTGSIAWVIYFKTENGGNDRPCNTLNPNATDDARQDQTTTTITFMEYTT